MNSNLRQVYPTDELILSNALRKARNKKSEYLRARYQATQSQIYNQFKHLFITFIDFFDFSNHYYL